MTATLPTTLPESVLDSRQPQHTGPLAWVRRRTGVLRLSHGALPTPTELFLDVVFVLAVSQAAAVLSRAADLTTMVRGFAVLMQILVYWTGLVLVGSVMSAERKAMRPVVITATVALAIVALAVPHIVVDGYSTSAVVFVAAMAVVQVVETCGVIMMISVVPAHPLNPGNAVMAIAAPFFGIAAWAMAIPAIGANKTMLLVGGLVVTVIIMTAFQLDFKGRMPFGSTEGFFPRATSVFTDRVAAVVVVALGGVVELLGSLNRTYIYSPSVTLYVLVFVALIVVLWWLHFGFVASRARVMFRNKTGVSVRAAALFAYFQGSMVMLLGLVLLIVGVARLHTTLTAEAVWRPFGGREVGFIYVGVVLYLSGQFFFWAVQSGRRCWLRLLAASILLGLIPVAVHLPALAVMAIPLVVCAALAVADNHHCRPLGDKRARATARELPRPRRSVPPAPLRSRVPLPLRLRLLGRYNTSTAVVTELELLVDVMAGFAVTQTAYLFDRHPSPAGAAQSILVLVTLWGCWSATTRLSNTTKADLGVARTCLIAAMTALLLLTLAAPGVFILAGDSPVATSMLALAYLAVRLLTASTMWFALNPAKTTTGLLFAAPVTVAMLIVAQALLPTQVRPVAWAAILLAELATSWLYSRSCPIIAPYHLVERHNLMCLLGLASVATMLAQATLGSPITVTIAATAALTMLTAAGLWWQYARHTRPAIDQLTHASPRQRHRFAAGPYAAGHLVLLASVIGICFAASTAIGQLNGGTWLAPMPTMAAVSLLCGLSGYQLALAILHWSLHRRLPLFRVAGISLPIGALAVSTPLPSLAVTALTTVVVVVLIGLEIMDARNPKNRARPGHTVHVPRSSQGRPEGHSRSSAGISRVR